MLQRVHHYNIIEELGKGGMGIVYKAKDTRLNRIVALKLLSPHLADDPGTKKRFLREAQLAASLQHQNICSIHDIGETPDGQLYISMDLYEGETLQKLILKDLPTTDQMLMYAIQITEGISAAHKNGIVHRDIKPGNIIITKEGAVKILDFGLAKQAGRYDSTQTGKALGTISYLSPEQAQGQKVDHLTDIWSLGVVLYEMATGILPFSHEYEAAVIYSILDKSPLPPTEIREDFPEEIERIIYKCLRKKKKERYQSATEILIDLNTCLTNLLPKSGQKAEVPHPRKRLSERRLLTIIASEIVNYSELLKGLGEEQSHVTVNRCIEIFATTSHKYGGTFTWKGKEGFTIVFGLPESLEKAPLLAVNACMELINRSKEFKLTLKSGIHSGMVIYKPVMINEREELTLSGNTLDFAHQLKDLASAGQIFVGPMIFRNTNKEMEYKALNPISSQVSHEPVPIYQLLSGKEWAKAKEAGSGRMIRSRMVGREKELDILQYHLLKLIHGEGSIISIVGEAGLGKSRLVAEFLKKEEIKRVKVLEGRALSTGQNLSFHPLVDILKDLANIIEADIENVVLHKLQSTVQDLCPDSAEEVFPFVATLMGLNLSGPHAELIKRVEGEGLEKLILKNLRTLFSGAAQQNPLVFIIEDLHWVDQSSLGMLKSLYRLAESHPILFINVLRPDYPEAGEPIRSAIRDRY
ncbi:MAG: protein kinase, partial [Bacteroidota bacterium]